MYIRTKTGWRKLYTPAAKVKASAVAVNIVLISRTFGLTTQNGSRLDAAKHGEVLSEWLVDTPKAIGKRLRELEKLHNVNNVEVNYL